MDHSSDADPEPHATVELLDDKGRKVATGHVSNDPARQQVSLKSSEKLLRRNFFGGQILIRNSQHDRRDFLSEYRPSLISTSDIYLLRYVYLTR